jgi:F420-dependent oxidoreductase-like protein
MTVFGVHAGLQNTDLAGLRRLWRQIEDLGFGWISIWDHFYSATRGRELEEPGCFEAVATHAALACDTSSVRCGSLVYCAGYRHPAVIAKAICTIDELSGGRADVGLGAGWSDVEYRAYGFPFPRAGIRLDMLEEAIQCVRGLLRDEVTNFHGKYFTLDDARCDPKPVQAELPIWIGGVGEQRTLRIAAQWADAWNGPFLDPDTFARKLAVLHRHCEDVGRDPAALKTAVNVGLAWTEESLQFQFGGLADYVRPGVLTGSDAEVLDRIGQYVDAGAGQVNLSLRAPFDTEALERFAAALKLS